MRCGHPVRWLEDRREQLVANANCREHHYVMSAYADETGKFVAFEGKAAVDSGAYSAYPFTSAIEASQVSAILPGPLCDPGLSLQDRGGRRPTNARNLPYRGVARPGVCFAMELMIDAIARRIGREPCDVRLANLVRPEQMPYDNVTDKHFDSGDYPSLLRMAHDAIGLADVRARQKRGEPDGRLIGVGFAIFSEQTAHGTTADGKRRALYEQVFARLTPDGRLDVRAGIQSIGQGLETTLAQIASEYLGIDPNDIAVRLGDTEITPLFERRVGLPRHRLGGRRDRASLQGADAARRHGSVRRCCRPTRPRSACVRAACSVRRAACRSPTSPARSISRRLTCPATPTPTASK